MTVDEFGQALFEKLLKGGIDGTLEADFGHGFIRFIFYNLSPGYFDEEVVVSLQEWGAVEHAVLLERVYQELLHRIVQTKGE
jgi:hypothetical protein